MVHRKYAARWRVAVSIRNPKPKWQVRTVRISYQARHEDPAVPCSSIFRANKEFLHVQMSVPPRGDAPSHAGAVCRVPEIVDYAAIPQSVCSQRVDTGEFLGGSFLYPAPKERALEVPRVLREPREVVIRQKPETLITPTGPPRIDKVQQPRVVIIANNTDAVVPSKRLPWFWHWNRAIRRFSPTAVDGDRNLEWPVVSKAAPCIF